MGENLLDNAKDIGKAIDQFAREGIEYNEALYYKNDLTFLSFLSDFLLKPGSNRV